MTAILSSLLGAFSVATGILLWLYLTASKSLKHYQSIRDVEAYQAECENASQQALIDAKRLAEEANSLAHQNGQQKKKIAQYQELLGNLKTAADLKQRIQTDTARAQQLSVTLGKLEHASQLDQHLQNQQAEIARKNEELTAYQAAIGEARSASDIAARVTYYENYLAQLKADVEAVEEVGQLQEFGFYNPRFEFDNSEAYKRRLDAVRMRQKAMLKDKCACACETEWTVDGSKREGAKMTNQKIRLMLRAFNGECDAAVGKVKYNNVVSLEKRVTRSFDAINKLGQSSKVHLAAEYCQLKYDELHLVHEYQEKKQDEREEAKRIREMMREEEKVVKEIEKAKNDAEKDEHLKQRALEKAREELNQKSGKQTEKLAALVAKLENELQAALDRKAKAIARAQLTRSGHVYVLSNIGSFGESVYKIGLTRRLEPLERVKELGGASVPFPFDVHAMIYSEDAPTLENELHKHFATRRVNMVNLRREFFNVTLDEIRVAVAEHFGHVTFVTVPEAKQYRTTIAQKKEGAKESSPLQIA